MGLDLTKKTGDPVVTEYNGSPQDAGSPGTYSYTGVSVEGISQDVDILRRQRDDDESGLFAGLENRQMGFSKNTTTGEVILIWKDEEGVRHDFAESDPIWEIIGSVLKPIESNPMELPDDLTITGIATVTQDPVSGIDLVRLSYLQANYYDKTTSDGKYALIGALGDYVTVVGKGFISDADVDGTRAFQGGTSTANLPENFCTVLNIQGGSNDKQFQIASYYGNADKFYFRHKNDGTNTWRPWKQISLTEDLANYYDKATSDGRFAPIVHGHVISDITGLQSALDGKAPTIHTHSISQVTNLQSELDDKADSSDLSNYVHKTTASTQSIVSGINMNNRLYVGYDMASTVNALRIYSSGAKENYMSFYNNSNINTAYIGFPSTIHTDFYLKNLTASDKIVLDGLVDISDDVKVTGTLEVTDSIVSNEISFFTLLSPATACDLVARLMPDGLIKLFGSITVAENEAYNQAIAWERG